MHAHEFIVATNQKLDYATRVRARDQRLRDRPRRARLSRIPPTNDGAFMEPSGRNQWQSVASRPALENGENKRNPLPPAATGCVRRSMVSRASAVGCHPLQEVPSLKGRRSISLENAKSREPEGSQDLTARL